MIGLNPLTIIQIIRALLDLKKAIDEHKKKKEK